MTDLGVFNFGSLRLTRSLPEAAVLDFFSVGGWGLLEVQGEALKPLRLNTARLTSRADERGRMSKALKCSGALSLRLRPGCRFSALREASASGFCFINTTVADVSLFCQI